MRAVHLNRAPTNPGLPGFARFWGSAFAHSAQEPQIAFLQCLGRIAGKTFLQESFVATEAGQPVSGSSLEKTFFKESFEFRTRCGATGDPTGRHLANRRQGRAAARRAKTFLQESFYRMPPNHPTRGGHAMSPLE